MLAVLMIRALIIHCYACVSLLPEIEHSVGSGRPQSQADSSADYIHLSNGK